MAEQDRINQFLRLQAQHESRVHGFILSLLPNWNDAEEVLQETVIVLWKKFEQFEPGSNYFAWACQIARYEVSRFLRRQHRDRLTFCDEVLDSLTRDTSEMHDQLAARQAALTECLKKLAETDAQLVRLRYEEGLTTQSIAERVGRSVHAVYKAMRRIHRLLHQCVDRTLSQEGAR